MLTLFWKTILYYHFTRIVGKIWATKINRKLKNSQIQAVNLEVMRQNFVKPHITESMVSQSETTASDDTHRIVKDQFLQRVDVCTEGRRRQERLVDFWQIAKNAQTMLARIRIYSVVMFLYQYSNSNIYEKKIG